MDRPPTSNPRPRAIVVGKTYDLVPWIVQKVEKFPKPYRFSRQSVSPPRLTRATARWR